MRSLTTSYTYDAANNLATAAFTKSSTTYTTSYSYDNAGQLTLVTYPSGTTLTSARTYDNADRLATVLNKQGSTTLSSFSYTLNANGNRTQVVDNAGTTTYAYDPLQQLTSVTYPGPTTDSYSYDATGNRTAKNATSYTIDAADQLTAAGGTSYGYDGNGNQTSRASDSFAWDHEDRMTSATISSATSTYSYDGDGMRRTRTVGGNTTTYTWDLAAGLPVILYDGTYNYIYGRGLIGRVDASNNQLWYLPDGLGSTANVRDASGNAVAAYTYDVSGAPAQTGASDNVFQFTGEQRDSESGYEYLRARYYDPAIGRFLGKDPVRAANAFAYMLNNPANLTDPTGRTVVCTTQEYKDSEGNVGESESCSDDAFPGGMMPDKDEDVVAIFHAFVEAYGLGEYFRELVDYVTGLGINVHDPLFAVTASAIFAGGDFAAILVDSRGKGVDWETVSKDISVSGGYASILVTLHSTLFDTDAAVRIAFLVAGKNCGTSVSVDYSSPNLAAGPGLARSSPSPKIRESCSVGP